MVVVVVVVVVMLLLLRPMVWRSGGVCVHAIPLRPLLLLPLTITGGCCRCYVDSRRRGPAGKAADDGALPSSPATAVGLPLPPPSILVLGV